MSSSAKIPTIAVEIAACSDAGLVRPSNEDAVLITDLNTGQDLSFSHIAEYSIAGISVLLVVSDGMGGQVAGEIASSLATTTLRDSLIRLSRRLKPYDRLVQAVEEVNYRVYKESQRHPEYKGMGATLTAALLEGERVYIAEVGDSRGYLIRNDRIKQLTTDQSLLNLFVSRGLLTAEEAEQSTNRGVLLQAIGVKEEIQVAVSSFPLQNGDQLLLCSDGLSNTISSQEMLRFVLDNSRTDIACQAMVQAANNRGGDDNITALVAKFKSDYLPSNTLSDKITTTIQALSTFDPDRQKSKRRTMPLSSVSPNITSSETVLPKTTVGRTPQRTLNEYEKRGEIKAEFERMIFHLDKAISSAQTQMANMRSASDWLQQAGTIDKRLTEIFSSLREASKNLEQTKEKIIEVKEKFKGK
ncbi:MAG: serine/threonine-protein phosphatase [Blastocatellia bacterium]|nr:serine/threonine-protein phosphatase [Blastocatellia bacterium]